MLEVTKNSGEGFSCAFIDHENKRIICFKNMTKKEIYEYTNIHFWNDNVIVIEEAVVYAPENMFKIEGNMIIKESIINKSFGHFIGDETWKWSEKRLKNSNKKSAEYYPL